jgi:hypothetical protein
VSNPVNHPAAVAEAAKRVEEAWEVYRCGCSATEPEDREAFTDAFSSWRAARCAARNAGYVEVMMSKEAVMEARATLPGLRALAPSLTSDLGPLLEKEA